MSSIGLAHIQCTLKRGDPSAVEAVHLCWFKLHQTELVEKTSFECMRRTVLWLPDAIWGGCQAFLVMCALVLYHTCADISGRSTHESWISFKPTHQAPTRKRRSCCVISLPHFFFFNFPHTGFDFVPFLQSEFDFREFLLFARCRCVFAVIQGIVLACLQRFQCNN